MYLITLSAKIILRMSVPSSGPLPAMFGSSGTVPTDLHGIVDQGHDHSPHCEHQPARYPPGCAASCCTPNSTWYGGWHNQHPYCGSCGHSTPSTSLYSPYYQPTVCARSIHAADAARDATACPPSGCARLLAAANVAAAGGVGESRKYIRHTHVSPMSHLGYLSAQQSAHT